MVSVKRMRNDVFMQKLSDKYYVRLYEYARMLSGDCEVAAKVVNETLEEAYLKADELKKSSNVEAWLYKAARYRVLRSVDITQLPGMEKEWLSPDKLQEEYDCEIRKEKKKSGGFFRKRKSAPVSDQKSDELSVKDKIK